jgi:hypothetical protein
MPMSQFSINSRKETLLLLVQTFHLRNEKISIFKIYSFFLLRTKTNLTHSVLVVFFSPSQWRLMQNTGATAGYVGFKQIRAIICAEPLHKQQSINRPLWRNNQSIWATPRVTWASSRSGRSSVPSPCTSNNLSIGLSALSINQYGLHGRVRGLQADQGDHLCRAPAQPTIHH